MVNPATIAENALAAAAAADAAGPWQHPVSLGGQYTVLLEQLILPQILLVAHGCILANIKE